MGARVENKGICDGETSLAGLWLMLELSVGGRCGLEKWVMKERSDEINEEWRNYSTLVCMLV